MAHRPAFYASYAHAFERVRRKRDILLLDQRGTGDSAPMICDFDEDVTLGQVSVEETIKYAQICLDELPHDPRYFTTSVAVRDLEALRVALGYPSLNVYGSSYGTRVAQHYARRYPDTARTLILDGVAPPQMPLGPDIATEAQKALDAIFNRCAGNEHCNDAFPDIDNKFIALKNKLRRSAVTVEFAHPTSGEKDSVNFGDMELAATIRLMSYSPTTVALMPLFVNEATNGNFVPLASTFVAVTDSLSEGLAAGMHNAVVCTEDTPYYEDMDKDALAQTYIGSVMTEALEGICSVWPAGVIDDDFHKPLATDTPVLLLSGSADPVTPPYFAELAAVELGNSQHLVGRNQGHGLAGQGCVPGIVGNFVRDASFENVETDCLERLFAMPFFLDHSGPSP